MASKSIGLLIDIILSIKNESNRINSVPWSVYIRFKISQDTNTNYQYIGSGSIIGKLMITDDVYFINCMLY